MEEFFVQISQPVWWISVIVVGILVNLVSAYLKEKMDRTMASTSMWWRNRSARRVKAWAELVSKIRLDEKEYRRALRKQDEHRFHTMAFATFGIFTVISATVMRGEETMINQVITIILFFMSTLLFGVAHIEFSGAKRISDAIKQAEKEGSEHIP